MTRFHIMRDGTPGICRATKSNCPLGENKDHFDNMVDALNEAQRRFELKYGLMPTEERVDITKILTVDQVFSFEEPARAILPPSDNEFFENNYDYLEALNEVFYTKQLRSEIDSLPAGETYRFYSPKDDSELSELKSSEQKGDSAKYTDWNGQDHYLVPDSLINRISPEFRPNGGFHFYK